MTKHIAGSSAAHHEAHPCCDAGCLVFDGDEQGAFDRAEDTVSGIDSEDLPDDSDGALDLGISFKPRRLDIEEAQGNLDDPDAWPPESQRRSRGGPLRSIWCQGIHPPLKRSDCFRIPPRPMLILRLI